MDANFVSGMNELLSPKDYESDGCFNGFKSLMSPKLADELLKIVVFKEDIMMRMMGQTEKLVGKRWMWFESVVLFLFHFICLLEFWIPVVGEFL